MTGHLLAVSGAESPGTAVREPWRVDATFLNAGAPGGLPWRGDVGDLGGLGDLGAGGRLARLLSGEPVAAWCEREVGVEAAVRARYLRLRPSRATALFEVVLSARPTWLVATLLPGRNLRRRLSEGIARLDQSIAGGIDELARRSGVGQPLAVLDDPPVLLEWFPASFSLPGLALGDEDLRLAFGGAGAELRPIVYKPERRAVLRWGETFLRAYASEAAFATATRAHRAAEDVGEPFVAARVRAFAPARVLAQARVDGSEPERSCHVHREVGVLLRHLHAGRSGSLAHFGPVRHLEAAISSARLVSSALPRLGRPLERLIASCRQRLPGSGELVSSHGDMHLGQVIDTGSQLRLLDPDWICRADPAFDLAAIAAHDVATGASSLSQALGDLDEVLAGYGTRPAELDWYLSVAIMRQSTLPLCRLDPDWKDSTAELVGAASRLLSGTRRFAPARAGG